MGKDDVVYIYTMEYYSAIKKNEIMPFSDNMDNLRALYWIGQKVWVFP